MIYGSNRRTSHLLMGNFVSSIGRHNLLLTSSFGVDQKIKQTSGNFTYATNECQKHRF